MPLTNYEKNIICAEIMGWIWKYCPHNKKWAWFFKDSSYKSELAMHESDKINHIYCLPDLCTDANAQKDAFLEMSKENKKAFWSLICDHVAATGDELLTSFFTHFAEIYIKTMKPEAWRY